MAKIIFTTYQAYPDFSQSDRLVATALIQQGHQVTPVPWESELAVFQAADLVIFRAHWNYHHHPQAFSTWLAALTTLAVPCYNSTTLVQWNLDKSYLVELQAHGVPMPVSRVLLPGETPTLIYAQQGWTSAVIKPISGASGHLVEHVAYADLAAWQANIRAQRAADKWLIQEFRPEIQAAGELSLIFVDGHFSHGVAKRPQQGEFRINSQYQGQIVRTSPSVAVLAQAQELLAKLPELPLYARIDGVVTADETFCLIELEVNEPGLYFHYAPECAVDFAAAIGAKLR